MNSTLALLSWRNIRANTTRLILSVLAVVLGTSFVAGGFILTASLQKAFDDIVESSYDGIDVVISSSPEYPLHREPILSTLAAMPEVGQSEANDSQPIALLVDDAPVQSGGAGSWIMPYAPHDERVGFTEEELVAGTEPREPFHAVINLSTAGDYGVGVGDTVTVIDKSGRHDFTIDGITDAGFAVGGWAGLEIPAEQYWADFAMGELASSISVLTADGTTPDELAAAIRNELPGAQVRTGEDAAKENSADIQKQLAFVSYVLLGFGLIALLVGVFIISNTFSMIVAQRTKDFALLRALGMSRAQLTGSVVAEALVIGLLGSLLGIVAGVGLVAAIVWGLDAAGLGFPNAGIGLDWKSAIIPVIIGVLVTVWGAWAPARRAGSVRPVEAMRSGDQSVAMPMGTRTVIGVALSVLGAAAAVAAAVWETETSTRAVLLGAGALGLIVGWWLTSAWLVRTVFRSTPRSGPAVITLAGTNLSRNPRRTASTAFALMLGVTLVATVGILGASMKQSIFGAIDDYMRADAVVSTGMITNQEFPVAAIDDIEALDSVEGTMSVVWAPFEVNGEAVSSDGVTGVSTVMETDPRIALDLEVVGGMLDGFVDKPAVGMSQKLSDKLGLQAGDLVEVTSPMHPEAVPTELVAVWDDKDVYTSIAVSPETVREVVPEEAMWTRQQTYVTFTDDVTMRHGIDEVTEAVEEYAVLQVMDRYEFREAGAAQVNGLLAVVYALLALSVIIAVLGIINTLALSITERRHEFGMLRAVGMQRGQVRRMITLESVAIAAVGAVAGIVLGTALGAGFVEVLSGEGLDSLLIPWGQLGILLAGALGVGVLAAIVPARQAARTHPLEAVS